MSEAKTVSKAKTGKNEEVRTEPQMPQLPKLNEDLTWDHEIHSIKYRLHEATIPELADAAAGARSEEEKQIRLLSLVVQEQAADGKWVPMTWPKTGAHRLYLQLGPMYWAGIAALESEFTKKSGQQSTKTTSTPTHEAESSVRP